jgi:small ligand-binding sensory domain FIST
VEHQPAVVMFAADWGGRLRSGGHGARVVTFSAQRDGDGWRLQGTDDVAVDGATLILLADPFSFPLDGFLDELHRRSPTLQVVGGMASAAVGPGGNRLVADDVVRSDGAVGLLLPPGVPVRAVVSQGCRPVGEPLVVTSAEANIIDEIAGRPALDRVLETASSATPDDRSLMARGLHIGVVADENQESFGRGDFLVRSVLGADKARRAVAVGAEVPVGSTVQFHVRDADSADEDLRTSLAGVDASAALMFTCTGRGTEMFGEAHHDASVLNDHVRHGATAGMFCAGEVGPVAGHPFVHQFSASMLLFEDSPAQGG